MRMRQTGTFLPESITFSSKRPSEVGIRRIVPSFQRKPQSRIPSRRSVPSQPEINIVYNPTRRPRQTRHTTKPDQNQTPGPDSILWHSVQLDRNGRRTPAALIGSATLVFSTFLGFPSFQANQQQTRTNHNHIHNQNEPHSPMSLPLKLTIYVLFLPLSS